MGVIASAFVAGRGSHRPEVSSLEANRTEPGRALAAFTLLLAVGCASTQDRFDRASVRSVQQRSPTPIADGSRPLELGKLRIKLARGRVIGTIQSGHGCVGRAPLTWTAGRENSPEDDFADALRQELTAAGYTVVGDPNALFEDPHERPEYVLAGLIKDVQANVCYAGSVAKGSSPAKGEASLAVQWQIFSNRTKAVELTLITEGASRLPNSTGNAVTELLSRALLSAERNLMADEQFRELVTGDGRREAKAETIPVPITVAYERAAGSQGASAESMVADSRMAVVTVFVGDAMGSGFVISPDGYVLTDQHVVGKGRYVKVRFVTGREVNGEVVRADRDRDVALIKLESDMYRALPLGESSRVRPGSEVYAIGTPLNERFGQSVTRGIISGYGEEEGRRTLRGDVSIHRGNSGGPLLDRSGAVVGMSVSGLLLMPEGVGVGLNQFIPIEEALEALGILQADHP
jgi:serine protease Do